MSLFFYLAISLSAWWVFFCQERTAAHLRREVRHLRERLAANQKLLARHRDLITQSEGGECPVSHHA